MESIAWTALLTARVLGLGVLGLGLVVACAPGGSAGKRAGDETMISSLDEIATAYVKLVLAVGEHDPSYVDAYYGPPEWREAAAGSLPPADLRHQVEEWLARFPPPAAGEEELVTLRRAFLERQLSAVAARLDMLLGKRFRFDEESRALYDAVAPRSEEAYFEGVLAELDHQLAAEGFLEGDLIARFEAFRNAFIVPPGRLDAVFRTAIEACRARTLEHVDLPAGENFVVEYVRDQPWSAYNWYQGDYQSLIQVNTDLPIYIDRALDLACHEGYPGHHVYNALLEKHLVDGRGWVEYTVYPLYSPQSLIAEGSANLGIEMAFPGEKRLAFERDVLFPLAGLDPSRAGSYDAVRHLVGALGHADNQAARLYLDGEIDAAAAAEWLTRYAAFAPGRAEQKIKFFNRYRSYVINYNLGLDLVRDYLDRRTGPETTHEERWNEFVRLLSSPRLPSGLAPAS